MPGMGMSFCPRSLKAAAFTALLGLCAMQVVGRPMASGTPATHGAPGAAGGPGTPGGPGRTHGSHGYSGTRARSAAVQATAARRAVRRSEGGGGLFLGAGHGQERSLADEGCSGDEEGSLFVDSEITSLKNPIGGCYTASSISNSSTNGYASYSLGGGGPSEGQAWIYATNTGVWMIGIVQETDDVTGEVLSLNTVCSSINNQAEELSGPTDSQLTGVWRCSYFEGGKTNYVEADFEGVECGCSGKSISESSGSGGYSSTAIAIATLTALVALLILVCLCFFHLKTRKAPTEDDGTTNMESEKENVLDSESASKEEAVAA